MSAATPEGTPSAFIKMANLPHHQINTGTLLCHSTYGFPFISSLLGSALQEPFPHLIAQASFSGTHQELFLVECPHLGPKNCCEVMSAMLMAKTTQEWKCCWVGWQVTINLVVGKRSQEGQLFKASLSYIGGLKPFQLHEMFARK